VVLPHHRAQPSLEPTKQIAEPADISLIRRESCVRAGNSGFSNIEPIACQTIYAAAAKLKDNGASR
jgi:hypothetical protein